MPRVVNEEDRMDNLERPPSSRPDTDSFLVNTDGAVSKKF